MRVRILITALLIAGAMWVGSFFVTRHAYRGAQDIGVMPNLHIKERLGIGDKRPS
ncbi:hypothetical protein QO002_006192 [Pararhizobium capsulatum DSM 1112]|uniref:Uncharacterized protein n=1 Tax=Pararhizobium capsulatum DSM 1112 TaxID=1121113 RepID=A0ABU0C0D9_9HYPH|nr:hypothetical protein [Pararhizobium capsulatum DSM 1112]